MSKKIMFSDAFGLTKAVIEGRKTMTRRIAKKQDIRESLILGKNILDYSRYKIGEVVAVAQSYQSLGFKAIEDDGFVYYEWCGCAGWNNKMFVKADFMQNRIRIIDIKFEKLQEISNEDCLKEGVIKGNFRDFPNSMYYPYKDCKDTEVTWNAKSAFKILFEKVSGKNTWDQNPYVFAYTFELI